MKAFVFILAFIVVSHAQSISMNNNRQYGVPRNVSYDRIAVTIDGTRKLLLSGAIHYPRSTPSMWPTLMQRSVDAGLNTIETYVFWNLHEPVRGHYDFSDRLNLAHFLELASKFELDVILRIGPYICAEHNYGGFPEWLKEIDGIQFRTYNQPFMTEMSRWVTKVVDYADAYLASRGGPIILVQIENEYGNVIHYHGELGKKYLNWCIEFANTLNVGIPWIMCEGSAGNALSTVNGFYASGSVIEHWKEHPDQPGIWTENWPGWFNAWGYAQNTRPAIDVAYSVLRFFAVGGTAMNYYMWHGGTNFGRTPSYLMSTSYDYDAPLDEFGFPHQPKYNHLAAIHKILNNNKDLLLQSYQGRPQPRQLGPKQFAYSYTKEQKKLTFLCNDDKENATRVAYEGKEYLLNQWSVVLIDAAGAILYDSSKTVDKPTEIKFEPFTTELQYQWWQDLRPGQHSHTKILVKSQKPIESLHLSHDMTDYTWYSRTFKLDNSVSEITFHSVADIAHVFIDGKYVNSTCFILPNSRGKLDGSGFTQKVTVDRSVLEPGDHEIAVLTTNIGMTKLEDEVGGDNLADDKRGIWGAVTLEKIDITQGNWTMQLGTVGEYLQIYEKKNSGKVSWESDIDRAINQSLTWFKTAFYSSQRGEHPVVIDFNGLKKGIAWINGNCIGRYNIMNSAAHGAFPPLKEKNFGKPVQRYYHVPVEWLNDKGQVNDLVFFEELGGSPKSVLPSHVLYQ